MDTKLSNIELTGKQVTRLSGLATEVVKGFAYWHDKKEVVVVSTRELSSQEQSDLKAAISALPDEYPQSYYRANFNLVLFQGDLAALLPSLSSPNLRWEFAALNTYATNKDFEGLVGYLEMLKTAQAATQDDVDAVTDILSKQGIVTE